jgi:hypothetical protein
MYFSDAVWYDGHLFQSTLEAQYARFFELLGYPYIPHPRPLPGWGPDFEIHVRCPFTLPCNRIHKLLVECKFFKLTTLFKDTNVARYADSLNSPECTLNGCDGILLLGHHPFVSWIGWRDYHVGEQRDGLCSWFPKHDLAKHFAKAVEDIDNLPRF